MVGVGWSCPGVVVSASSAVDDDEEAVVVCSFVGFGCDEFPSVAEVVDGWSEFFNGVAGECVEVSVADVFDDVEAAGCDQVV